MQSDQFTAGAMAQAEHAVGSREREGVILQEEAHWARRWASGAPTRSFKSIPPMAAKAASLTRHSSVHRLTVVDLPQADVVGAVAVVVGSVLVAAALHGCEEARHSSRTRRVGRDGSEIREGHARSPASPHSSMPSNPLHNRATSHPAALQPLGVRTAPIGPRGCRLTSWDIMHSQQPRFQPLYWAHMVAMSTRATAVPQGQPA